jgi:F0F1-type ATP synthase beta subunit
MKFFKSFNKNWNLKYKNNNRVRNYKIEKVLEIEKDRKKQEILFFIENILLYSTTMISIVILRGKLLSINSGNIQNDK